MSERQDHVREAIKTAEAAFTKAIDKTKLMMNNKIWGAPISDAAYDNQVAVVRTYINGGNDCGQGLASRLMYSENAVIPSMLEEALLSPMFNSAVAGNLIKAYVRSFRDTWAKLEPLSGKHAQQSHS